ncbi:MAG: SDR family oxidoreductase [Lentisphaeria bacterium]|nr:SDR family oxidoreductase [Lentisphaeria bacterium]
MSYLETQFGLAGHKAVITGGGGAICGAIAEGFLRAGASVALWGRHMSVLEEKKAVLPFPERITLQEVDLSDEEAVKSALAETGDCDILVNGVGGSSCRMPLVEADVADFEAVVRQNLVAGCFLPTRIFARMWIEKEIPGCILNIASMGSYNPLSGAWAYSAAKAAVMNQTMAHARELAPYGIRVNAIAPGFFLGKQNRKLLVQEDGTPTERGARVLKHTPAGRFGEVAELAPAAVFLCSGGAGFVTGVTLPVDGGYLTDNI